MGRREEGREREREGGIGTEEEGESGKERRRGREKERGWEGGNMGDIGNERGKQSGW